MKQTDFSRLFTRGGWRPTDILNDLQRAGQLLFNRRVPLALKLLLPVGAAVYWFFPLDLIPGLPFDDIAILLLATKLFVSLSDQALQRTPGQDEGPAVDTTWRVVDE